MAGLRLFPALRLQSSAAGAWHGRGQVRFRFVAAAS